MKVDINSSIIFKSKLDTSFLIVIISSIMIGITTIFLTGWIGVVFLAFILTLTLPILGSTYYQIEDNILYIKSGLLYKKKIEIPTIYKITVIKTFNSAPALAMRRLEVFYNKFDSVMIAPKEEVEFINILMEINPNIEIKE